MSEILKQAVCIVAVCTLLDFRSLEKADHIRGLFANTVECALRNGLLIRTDFVEQPAAVTK